MCEHFKDRLNWAFADEDRRRRKLDNREMSVNRVGVKSR